MFSFDSAEYVFSEDAGAVSLGISLMEGNLGLFTVSLTTATDDSNATATGKKGCDS